MFALMNSTHTNTETSAVKVTRKTYSKQLHTFIEDGKPMKTIVYGGLVHLNDAYGNIIVEDLGEGKYEGGRYMLVIGADSWVSDNLVELEAILFPWMESEGYEYDEEVK
jgi:hypothetical protein